MAAASPHRQISSAILTSMNLNKNPEFEYFYCTRDPNVAGLLVGIAEEIWRCGLAAAIVILESRDKRTDVYVCGYGKIAKHGAMHRSTAIHAVNKLVERGWFQKLSGGLGKAGELLPNRYLPQWSRLG